MPAAIEFRTLALIETGAVATLGLGLLLTRARPAASRAADDRRAAAASDNQTAFFNRDRDTRLEHQECADAGAGYEHPLTKGQERASSLSATARTLASTTITFCPKVGYR